MKSFTFIDLFAGIGGFRMAAESLGGKCVFTSEWNKSAQKTYSANFSMTHPITGDIKDVNEKDVPDHDILFAGFPCQPFSAAAIGVRNTNNVAIGLKDAIQGTCFFDIVRILKEKRPTAFLLENVPNIMSVNNGQDFGVIINTLQRELGYDVQWQIINSNLWVPQKRKRIYIVGYKDTNIFDFENNTNHFNFEKIVIPKNEKLPTLETVLHPEDGTEKEEPPYTLGKLAKVADSFTLSDYTQRRVYEKIEKYGKGFTARILTKNDVTGTLCASYNNRDIIIEQPGKNHRAFTPRECARLMGFDKRGENKFVIPVSVNQSYRQFGNAIVVPVVKRIIEQLIKYL